MGYTRFLTDGDYELLATSEHMKQLVGDMDFRMIQAEQRAETQVLEYLDQYYEVGELLNVGKRIRDYSSLITYPGLTYVKFNGKVYKTISRINGIKKPTAVEYWRRADVFDSNVNVESIPKYTQLKTYVPGDIVLFGEDYWVCLVPNGYEIQNVQMPATKVWQEAETILWQPNHRWLKNQVCIFRGNFYQYMQAVVNPDEVESMPPDDLAVITPEEDDNWGLIGAYSQDYEYDYSEGAFDYVVAEDKVFYPIMNPNPDKPEEGVNIILDDPRNSSIVNHMSKLAIYHLHAAISPTNVPESRKWAYDDSMLWLYNASKFKINPQLPRKKDSESGDDKVDWAIATFQRDYNPNENSWLI